MRIVIITRISSGLGKALFDVLLTTSAKIFGIGRSCPASAHIHQPNFNFIQEDLSDPRNLNSIPSWIGTEAEEIIFINNAAVIEPISRVGELKDLDIHTAVTVNYTSPVKISNLLIALAEKRKLPFRLLNISTGAAKNPFAGWAIYCSTKASFRMFCDCVQLEFPKMRIKHIDTGIMDTPMQKTIRHSSEDSFPEKQKFITYKQEQKLQSPQDIACRILQEECLL